MPICPYSYLHSIIPEIMKQIQTTCSTAVGLQHELLPALFFFVYINPIQLYIISLTSIILKRVYHTQISAQYKLYNPSNFACFFCLRSEICNEIQGKDNTSYFFYNLIKNILLYYSLLQMFKSNFCHKIDKLK